MSSTPSMVEFRGVSKVYRRAWGSRGRVHALSEVSFRVEAGEVVILAGPTGAGKSTVLRLIAGEERPTAGHVTLEGQDLSRLGRRAIAGWRRTLGVVPQEPRLVSERTAFGNVALVLRALGFPGIEVRARAVAALGEVGLAGRASALPAELARGERQRLVLARALAPGPRLLLADEPFTGLDSAEVGELLTLLTATRGRGATVLLAMRMVPPAGAGRVRTLTLDHGRVGPDVPAGR